MKKGTIGLLIGAAVVVVVGAILWFTTMSKSPSVSFGSKDACNYLTQDIADTVLGAGATKGNTSAPTESEDVSVSTCVYTSATDDTLESIRNIRSASLLVRSPLTAAGAESNKVPFDDSKQSVGGYGEKAFWDPELGQLNVLVKENWLIISVGKSSIQERTLEEAKQLADRVVPKLTQ